MCQVKSALLRRFHVGVGQRVEVGGRVRQIQQRTHQADDLLVPFPGTAVHAGEAANERQQRQYFAAARRLAQESSAGLPLLEVEAAPSHLN